MNNNWKSPTSIIGIATLVLSIFGNVYQYYHLQNEQNKSQAEISKSQAEVSLLNQQKLELQEKSRRLDEIEDNRSKLTEDLNSQIKKIDDDMAYMQKKINNLVYSETKFGDEEKWITEFYKEIDKLKEQRLKLQTLVFTVNK